VKLTERGTIPLVGLPVKAATGGLPFTVTKPVFASVSDP